MTATDRPEGEAPPLSPDQLAAVLGGVADGVIVTDGSGRVRFVNDAAANIARFTGDAAFRRDPFGTLVTRYDFFDEAGNAVPPENLPTQRAMRGEGDDETILRVRERATGQDEWWAVRVTPFRGARGTLETVVAMFRDITDQQRAEEEVRQSREQLAFLAEASDILAASFASDALFQHIAELAVPRIADWCAVDLLHADGALEAVAVAHVDPNKVALAREFRRRYPPNLYEGRGATEALRTGRALLISQITDDMVVASAVDAEHLRMIRALELHSIMVLPLSARGRMLGRLTLVSSTPPRHYGPADLAFAEELARRVALAMDNARLFREAQASEARYRGLFEGVADAVLVFDAEGYYIDANTAASVIYGESREDLLQRRIGDTPEMREESLRNFARLTQERTFRGETILHRRDGTTIPVESRTTAVHLSSGTIYVTVMRDISERVRVEEERRQFVAMVAHELRNPLSALIGYAELLRRRERYDAKAVETIIAQGKRLERLTLDLRETLRAQVGRLDLKRGPVDTRALILSAIEQAQTTTAAHTLHVQIPDDLPPAEWDADRITQVLGNLLLNAIQYTPAGGDVRVQVTDTGTCVRVAIADSGMGIPPEALPRIFEPFYRAANAQNGSARGMGLGLPISKALVEAHGGTIAVESTINAGTTFAVTLPYQALAGNAD